MAPITPPDTVQLVYNGFDFQVYSHSWSLAPVLDAAGRTVKWVEFTISVRAYVLAGSGASDSTADEMEELQQKLTEQGATLTVEGTGFGLILVNGGGGEKDVNFGPIPHMISATPVGADRAYLVEWSCKCHLARCPAALSERGILAFTWAAGTDIDQDGYLTRNVSGSVEIAMTRQEGTRTLPDHVDRLRESVTGDVPIGFQRTRLSWNPEQNKRVAAFSFTDAQIPAALPQFTTRCELRHRLKNSRANTTARMEASLSGTIVVPAGYPKSWAWEVFLGILHDRVNRSRIDRNNGFANLQRPPGFNNFAELANNFVNNLVALAASAWAMILHVSVDNDVTGRGVSFSADWWIFNPRPLRDVIAGSGVFAPLPGTNFQMWKASMDQSAWRPRGSVDYRESGQDDAIIDVCVNDRPVVGKLGAVVGKRGTAGPGPTVAEQVVGAIGRGLGQLARGLPPPGQGPTVAELFAGAVARGVRQLAQAAPAAAPAAPQGPTVAELFVAGAARQTARFLRPATQVVQQVQELFGGNS